MFRVRRVLDDVLPINRAAIAQVRQILAEQFDELPDHDLDSLEEKLRNPFPFGFRPVLFVAEGARRDRTRTLGVYAHRFWKGLLGV